MANARKFNDEFRSFLSGEDSLENLLKDMNLPEKEIHGIDSGFLISKKGRRDVIDDNPRRALIPGGSFWNEPPVENEIVNHEKWQIEYTDNENYLTLSGEEDEFEYAISLERNGDVFAPISFKFLVNSYPIVANMGLHVEQYLLMIARSRNKTWEALIRNEHDYSDEEEDGIPIQGVRKGDLFLVKTDIFPPIEVFNRFLIGDFEDE